MSLFLKPIYSMLTGAIGTLTAWFVIDWVLKLQPSSPYADALLNGALVGICVGMAVNGFSGLLEFKLLTFLRRLLVGFLAGLVGGSFGLLSGEFFYQLFGRSDLLRIIGWTIFGISLGLADGILAFSFRRIIYAGFGGFLGGLLGGTAFSVLAHMLALPNVSRAVGFALLGALIGFFIGLIPIILSNARLKVISTGRNEGKEILLDKPKIVIGADERCDLSLYGDPGIAEKHAQITQNGISYSLRPIGNAPVLVNGQPIASHDLQNEETFQIGKQMVLFRKKSSP